jgi:hypothetical protein
MAMTLKEAAQITIPLKGTPDHMEAGLKYAKWPGKYGKLSYDWQIRHGGSTIIMDLTTGSPNCGSILIESRIKRFAPNIFTPFALVLAERETDVRAALLARPMVDLDALRSILLTAIATAKQVSA